jgi:predicted lipoprotein with Yx(FWY)xxD motif
MSDRLFAGQWMTTDAPLISANGRYAAYLQDDANLVLCYTTNGAADLSRPYWSVFANAAGQVGGPRTGPHYYAVMQSDGNFVLYNGPNPASQGPPYWATGTNRAQGQYTAIMQTDGNFVVYDGSGQPIWASNTEWVSWQVTSGDRLNTNQWIVNDAAMVSADRRYAAYLQDDGNLVLCYTTNGAADLSRPYWSVFAHPASGQVRSQPSGPPYHAVMQSDGNFVLYDGRDPGNSGPPYWATNTSRARGQFTAVMQTDGNFVVYDGTGQPIWASHTEWVSQQVTRADRLTTGQWMTTDAPLISANGSYAAYLQDDANLVVCQTTNGAADLSKTYWSVFANAAGQARGPHTGPHYYAVMQSDGNFVLYNGPNPGSQGPPYWASNTDHPQPTAAVATIRNDGTFAVLPGNDVLTTQAPLFASAVVTDPQAKVIRIISGADQTLTVWGGWTQMPFPQPLKIQLTYQNYVPVPGVQVTFGQVVMVEETGLFFGAESVGGYQTTTDAQGYATCQMWGQCWFIAGGGNLMVGVSAISADNALLATATVRENVMGPPTITGPTAVISLRAHANGKIVTADNAGASPLIANRTAIGQWDQFLMITNLNGNGDPDGTVSFLAYANDELVTADNAGASPLIANRTAIGSWEKFNRINNADGSVSFRAQANGKIVTADNAGASPLIANRTAIGPWEEFDLIQD